MAAGTPAGRGPTARGRGPTSRLLSSSVQYQHHPILMAMVIMPGPATAPDSATRRGSNLADKDADEATD